MIAFMTNDYAKVDKCNDDRNDDYTKVNDQDNYYDNDYTKIDNLHNGNKDNYNMIIMIMITALSWLECILKQQTDKSSKKKLPGDYATMIVQPIIQVNNTKTKMLAFNYS